MNTPYVAGDHVEVLYGLTWRKGIVQIVTDVSSLPDARAPLSVLVEFFHDEAGRYMLAEGLCDREGNTDNLQFIPETADCTCHTPPRAITRKNKREEWGHVDDETFAEVFHVHVDHSSRDCDGPLDRSYTYQVTSISDCEFAADLWRALVRMEVCSHAERQQIEIRGDEHVATFQRTTDEGYHNVTMHGCSDPSCAHDGSTQRDHYAEAMGY